MVDKRLWLISLILTLNRTFSECGSFGIECFREYLLRCRVGAGVNVLRYFLEAIATVIVATVAAHRTAEIELHPICSKRLLKTLGEALLRVISRETRREYIRPLDTNIFWSSKKKLETPADQSPVPKTCAVSCVENS